LIRLYIKRLRKLNEFLNGESQDGTQHNSGAYQVWYGGFGVNYSDLLSRSDAFHVLPIIPEVDGGLGESYDATAGEQIFISGIKFKLNGRVQTYPTVFDYYLDVLNPRSQLHQERKTQPNYNNQHFVELVLKVALVYFFVFTHMDDEEYDPSVDVDRELLSILRKTDEGDEPAKEDALLHLYCLLREKIYTDNLKAMRDTIKHFLHSKKIKFETETKSLHLSIIDSIIDDDEQRMLTEKEFFRSEAFQEKGKNALKYLQIEEATAGGSDLASLPVVVTIEPIYYHDNVQEHAQSFTMRYNLRYHRMLPIMLFPNTTVEKQICQTYYQNYRRIVFPYQPQLPFKADTPSGFVYRFTYMLLSYLVLKLLFAEAKQELEEQEKKTIFAPIIRIHTMPRVKQYPSQVSQEDSFLRAMAQSIAHVLGADFLTTTQGFSVDVLRTHDKYRLDNGLSSLYSVLPKAFTLDKPPLLDKMAIIVVSSRKCDAHRDSSMHLATIYGETILLQCDTRGNVHVTSRNKFSANEDSENMYHHPTAILEEAKKCYERGVKHLFYVAMAPYNSMLHVTSADSTQDQFFMSKDIIQALKNNRDDMHVYPIYSDKYYVVKLAEREEKLARRAESMYIDDTSELRRLFNDPNQSSVVFFNLLNGFTIDDTKVYNGVVSYATLINVYDDLFYDQMIRKHLLDETQPGSLKQEFLNFLTVFHFSRYERRTDINFKLDPYENIIGVDSVGSAAVIPHMLKEHGTRFNMLGFLTVVRSVLNKDYTGYLSTLLDEKPEDDATQDDMTCLDDPE
jgi:hypothetical protein